MYRCNSVCGNLLNGFYVGTSSSESWAYVLIIVILALLFVLIIPVLGFMYMDIRQERILMESNIKRIEKLKKEVEAEKEK